MSVWLPRMIDGNVLIGPDDTHAAIFRADMIGWPFHSAKKAWWSRVAYVAYEARASFTVLLVNRTYPVEDYQQQALELLDDRYATRATLERYLAGHADHLADRAAFSPEVYLVAHLPSPTATGLGQGIAHDLDRARHRVEQGMHAGGPRPVPAFELAALHDARDDARRKLASRIGCRDATTREILWLYRRMACRGYAEPGLERNWQPNALEVETTDGHVAYEPLGHDLVRLLRDPVRTVTAPDRDGGTMLQVRSEDHGELWQACLVMGPYPEETDFPGDAELLYRPREAVDFPVDACVHVEWVSNKAAAAKIKRKVRDAHTVVTDQEEAAHGVLSFLPEETAMDALAAERYTRSQAKPPWLKLTVSLIPAAHPVRGVVKARVDALRAQFGTIDLIQPAGEQEALYYDHAPRADGGAVRDWVDWWTIEQFAALSPLATNELGTKQGTYFAHIANGSRRPAFLNLREAATSSRVGAKKRTSRATVWVLAGAPGKGKTTTAQSLVIADVLLGGVAIDLDIKRLDEDSTDHNLERIPELEGRVEVTDLDDPDLHAGAFDPLVIAPASRRIDVAHNYLAEMLPAAAPARWGTEVRRAVIDTVEQDRQPCCNAVLDRLLRRVAGEDANAAGDTLATWARAGLAKLGFSSGIAATLDLDRTKQVHTIRPSVLQLPAADVPRASYRPIEALSVATLGLIVQKAMRLFNSDRTLHKTLYVGEGHFLFDNPEGQRLVSDVSRTGRAKFVETLIDTQHISDPGAVLKLAAAILAFGTETPEEAADLAQALGLDRTDDDVVSLIHRQGEGECVMRDIYGMVAPLRIDPVYAHILEVLDTTPGSREKVAA